MAEVKDLVAVRAGFCHVEIALDQRHQQGIKDEIHEFVEYFVSFLCVRLAGFLTAS